MEYDAVIIGAGVAGLASALKLSCEGKNVLLLERQPLPGGYATTFQRKGFIFESSIHCVDALGPGAEIRNFLEETGVDKKINFIELAYFSRIIYPEHDFVVDANRENFINFLKTNFPGEKKNINRLFYAIDRFYRQFDHFADSELPLWIKLILSPFIYRSIIKTSSCTLKQFIERYIKDKKLFALITDLWRFLGLPPSRLSAFYFLVPFREYYYRPSAYVKGGFSKLFQAMAEEIKKNGSEVKFNTNVKKIVTDKHKEVKSVVTDKNEEFPAKAVVSNANAWDTLVELIDNAAIKEKYRKQLAPLEKSISAFQVYLGLSVPAKKLGMSHYLLSINPTYDAEENFNYSISGDYDNCLLEIVDHAQIDPSLAPEGKGSLLIFTADSYKNWTGLETDAYKKKKEEVAAKLINRAEKYIPGLKKYIEVMEVATPRTMHNYTLSPEGAIYGFSQTVNQAALMRLSQETRIKGLFLAGAWTRPGAGVHGCFISGIEAAELALKFLR